MGDMMKVSKQENFMLSTDSACEADRPEGQKKNKKFIPNCAGVSTPSIHPLKEPTRYSECWEAAKDFQPCIEKYLKCLSEMPGQVFLPLNIAQGTGSKNSWHLLDGQTSLLNAR